MLPLLLLSSGCETPKPAPVEVHPIDREVEADLAMAATILNEVEANLEMIEYAIVTKGHGAWKRESVAAGDTKSFVWGEENLLVQAGRRDYFSWGAKIFGCERLATPSAGEDVNQNLNCSFVLRDDIAPANEPVSVYGVGSVTVGAIGLPEPVYEGHLQYIQVNQWSPDPKQEDRLGWAVTLDPSKKTAKAYPLKENEYGAHTTLKESAPVPLNFKVAQLARAEVLDVLQRAENATK